MLYFENDYCEGAHPAILQKLTETNFEKVSGYGTDPYCASARETVSYTHLRIVRRSGLKKFSGLLICWISKTAIRWPCQEVRNSALRWQPLFLSLIHI